jgi:hypothetical protein
MVSLPPARRRSARVGRPQGGRAEPGARQAQPSVWGGRLPRGVAMLMGLQFVAFGAWAMVRPRSFFDALATFEPYNEHFLQDIGAFQVGLGAVLLLACWRPRADGLATALLGAGVGAALHAVSHLTGRELGGKPETDIPLFVGMAAVTLAAGARRWNRGPTA